MNFLVTGGSGYLGSHLLNFLRDKNYNVVNIDTNTNSKFNTLKLNILDIDKIKDVFVNNKIDVVIHNTAKVPITKNKKNFYDTNVIGTKNILEVSKKYNVKKFVYISSSAVYGIPNTLPITEETQKIPVEPYGESKKIAEEECFKNYENLSISIIRPRTIIGKNRFGIFSVLFDWISRGYNVPVLKNGENLYQFIDIEDLTDAIFKSIFVTESGDFNIGADDYFSIRELLQKLINKNKSSSKIKDISGSKILKLANLLQKINLIPLHDYHFMAYGENIFFDCNKAKTKLNWKPKKDNFESLQESYQFFLNGNDEITGKSAHQKKIKTALLRYGTLFI